VDAAALQALTQRLVALGDLDKAVVSAGVTDYGDATIRAVTRFQARHGLTPDGIIGRATQAALSVPLSWRVRQIEMSLERLRWLPDLTGTRVIVLNIPMFHLWAWEADRPDGKPAFNTRAIVGRALRTQTPMFVEDLREVVFRPYWNVPRSIVRGEILPLAAKDAGYFQRHNMEIVQGPGDDAVTVPINDDALARLREGTVRLRQRPGPHNALGLVKFVFPNNDNVYLHGTPAQELFSRARRDFSHGCVRVEDPTTLAEWVLNGQPAWTRDQIVRAMADVHPQRVPVERPVQVVLFYLTAAVLPETGAIHFAEDIYRHDAALDRALVRRIN
jgi:murein L,D-transpeptidase YcbB/YkuD